MMVHLDARGLMERAFNRFSEALAVVFLAGAIASASMASENSITVVTKGALARGVSALPLTPGFGLVATEEHPLKLADYTISNLIILATPWPIEETLPQAKAPTLIVATPSVTKRKPKPRPIVPRPADKLTWVKADWWRQLTWLRIR